MKSFLKNNPLLFYVVKFIGAFCICYYGTFAVIGLAAPGRYYSSFIDHYFNYISWLRASLLYGSKALLGLFDYNASLANQYRLKLSGGSGVSIVYSCLGYGIMSFWIALIFANKGRFVRKLLWIIGGLFCIWAINVTRISLLLIVINKHRAMPLGIDHHTWFSIFAYLLIFILIYFYDKSGRIRPNTIDSEASALKVTEQ